MGDAAGEELGPIDYMVVEFEAGTKQFSQEMARELASLAEADLIRIMDLLVIEKAVDGSVDGLEVEDMGDLGDLRAVEGQLAEILALEDVVNLAEAMDPGTAAGVLVWENTWAAPFAVATRESGGQLIASGRIPTQALIAAFEADDGFEGG